MKKLFYNDRLIYTLIILNVVVIYLHSFEFLHAYYFHFDLIDVVFTLFFCIEIAVKIATSNGKNKLKSYMQSPWNRIDFFSVILAIPSIGVLFISDLEVFAGFTALRSLRIFKLLRVIEYIPEGKRISKQLFKALKSIAFIIFAFFIYTTIISLISVTLFRHAAPIYFQNAFESFFTIFKVFSGDGFSDIVDVIQENSSVLFTSFSKFYFVGVVFSGSILGLSLINSVFIDQMNQVPKQTENGDTHKLDKLKKEIDDIKLQQKEIIELLKNKSGKS
jgi:voltage-gated sodium channel